MEFFLVLISTILLFSYCPTQVQSQDYIEARLQPELDVVDVDKYLQNDRLFNFQMQCIIWDGPCDIVGKWLKPRIPYALLGQCYKCTPKQEKNMDKILNFVIENHPDIYRAAVSKYLEKSDIQISDAEKANIRKVEASLQPQDINTR